MSIINGNVLMFGKPSSDGGGAIFAAISVIYPEGSTCTATNGTQTLTASDTSGEYIFSIPEPSSLPETWTISCTDGTNTDTETVSITAYGQFETVTLKYVDLILNNNSWADISEVSKAGTGNLYWDIGDCKAVTLSGKIGSYLTLSNTTLYVFILDFNHPINKTTADNNIIWGGFKTALTGGKDVALCDSGYGSDHTSGKYFNINHVNGQVPNGGNTNLGGWKCSDFRYDILGATSTAPNYYNQSRSASYTYTGYDAIQATITSPVSNTLMAALPSDLRAVLRLWNRYVDSYGYNSNSDSHCNTATIDAISLLAEFEIFGAQSWANTYEQNHQKQMAYYTSGNSKIKYKHNATGTACKWMISSPPYLEWAQGYAPDMAYNYCIVNDSGESYNDSTSSSLGLAPAFRT